MVRYRSKLVAPILCAALAHTARGEVSAAGERLIQASIGNHGSLFVRYRDTDLGQVTVESRHENGSVALYVWQAQDGLLAVTEAGEEQNLSAQHDPAAYVTALRKMRDLIAYAAGPERYEWLVFGASILSPELNRVIARIDQALGQQDAEDVNCQLLIDREGMAPLIVSGGAFGDLGAFSKSVSKVWVKKGYTLVLVSNPLFDTGHDVKLVRVLGEERRASTELPMTEYDPGFSDLVEGSEGTSYTLSGSLLEGAVQSIICRPDLRS